MRRLRAAIAGLALSALPVAPVAAQSTYLDGATLEFNSSFSEGSAGESLMQILVKALGRALPQTQMVFRANSGGTAALAAAIIAEAEPDGLTIGSIDTDSLIAKATGDADYDLSDFTLLGALDREFDVLMASTPSGITSLAQLVALEQPVILPTRSVTSGAYYNSLLLNAFLGTRIRPVTGYDGGARTLAFVSGEAQVAFLGLSASRQIVADGQGIAILKMTDLPIPPELGDPPALSEFFGDPEFAWVVDFSNARSLSHIIGVSKSTPPERVAALRAAFDRAVADPQYITEASALIIPVPLTGAQVEAVLADMRSRITSLSEALDHALDCGMQIAETATCQP